MPVNHGKYINEEMKFAPTPGGNMLCGICVGPHRLSFCLLHCQGPIYHLQLFFFTSSSS